MIILLSKKIFFEDMDFGLIHNSNKTCFMVFCYFILQNCSIRQASYWKLNGAKAFMKSQRNFYTYQNFSRYFNSCYSVQIASFKTISSNSREITGLKIQNVTSNLLQPHCTELPFASFLSSGFIAMAVINPPEKKLAKGSSVHCFSDYCTLLVFLV